MNDNIKTYLVTVRDNQHAYCPSCASPRPIYVGDTEGGQRLTCCCFCSYVLKREASCDLAGAKHG